MRENFAKVIPYIQHYEGGKVDDPRDPGGRTNEGITQATYDGWREKNNLPVLDVWLMPDTDRDAIYKVFWDDVRADELPSGIDFCLFNGGWGSGPPRAIKWAQAVVQVKVDGKLGPATMAAIQAMDPVAFINAYLDTQLAFMQSLSIWVTYGKGWSARVASVRKVALSWVTSDPPIAGAQPSGEAVGGKPISPGGAQGTVMATATVTATAAAPAVPRVIPSITQSARMDCGSLVDQIAEMARPFVADAVAAGEDMVLHAVPYGFLVEMVFGPNIVKGYVNQAITFLEGIDDAWVVTVTDDGSMASKAEITVINMINTYEPNLVVGMGAKFIPWVKEQIAKYMPAAKAA